MPEEQKNKTNPKWVIDANGIVQALTTTKNSVRSGVVQAIESGELIILKNVSNELKEAYENIYKDFASIKKKKYTAITVAVTQVAAAMMEDYGASLLGSVPPLDRFEEIAVALTHGCGLITFGKALTDCNSIIKKCGIDVEIVDVSTFPT